MLPPSVLRRFIPATLALLAACAPTGPTLMGNPQAPYPLQSPPEVGEIVHLPTGTPVSMEQMLSVAADAHIVYLGETHDNPASHRLEVAVLQDLAARRPGRVALGMEMFSRAQQPVLDRWVAGELSEKEFLEQSRWFEQWSMDFDYYRDLLNFARDEHIPVIGLNAEKSLVRAVRAKVPAELSTEEQAQLPEMDMTDPYQRALVLAILGDHSHGGMDPEGFVRAQTLWDETMAESVARYLQSPQGEDHQMLVVAGGNHVRYGFGIPRRVFRRLPTSYVLLGGREINISQDKESRLMDVEVPEFPMIPYDFLTYLNYEDLPHKPVRLGVMIEPARDAGGLTVMGVMPESDAARAGLQKGDRLLAVDGEPLTVNFDLVYLVKQKAPGDKVLLRVQRGEDELEVPVTFTAARGHGR